MVKAQEVKMSKSNGDLVESGAVVQSTAYSGAFGKHFFDVLNGFIAEHVESQVIRVGEFMIRLSREIGLDVTGNESSEMWMRTHRFIDTLMSEGLVEVTERQYFAGSDSEIEAFKLTDRLIGRELLFRNPCENPRANQNSNLPDCAEIMMSLRGDPVAKLRGFILGYMPELQNTGKIRVIDSLRSFGFGEPVGQAQRGTERVHLTPITYAFRPVRAFGRYSGDDRVDVPADFVRKAFVTLRAFQLYHVILSLMSRKSSYVSGANINGVWSDVTIGDCVRVNIRTRDELVAQGILKIRGPKNAREYKVRSPSEVDVVVRGRHPEAQVDVDRIREICVLGFSPDTEEVAERGSKTVGLGEEGKVARKAVDLSEQYRLTEREYTVLMLIFYVEACGLPTHISDVKKMWIDLTGLSKIQSRSLRKLVSLGLLRRPNDNVYATSVDPRTLSYDFNKMGKEIKRIGMAEIEAKFGPIQAVSAPVQAEVDGLSHISDLAERLLQPLRAFVLERYKTMSAGEIARLKGELISVREDVVKAFVKAEHALDTVESMLRAQEMAYAKLRAELGD